VTYLIDLNLKTQFIIKMSEENFEIIRFVNGVREYREFKIRTYVHSINDALKNHLQLDMGARLSILINYFRAGKWCSDCLSFVVKQMQDEILVPKDEKSFVYAFYLCPECADITKNYLDNL